MEIKIDTKTDSPEDIKKAIAFLRTLTGEQPTPASFSSAKGFGNNDENNDAGASAIKPLELKKKPSIFDDAPAKPKRPDSKNIFSSKDGERDEEIKIDENSDKIQIVPY